MLDAVFDISHYQGKALGFNAAKLAGMLGVIHKATQGIDYVDPTWASHRQSALPAGLKWGSYHFLTADAPGADQARFFLETVGPYPGELLALDFESSGQSASLAQAADFVETIYTSVGRWPVLYAGGYLKGLLVGAVTAPMELLGCELWLAQYGPAPAPPKGWASWALWQYADGRTVPAPPVPGIGACDRDRFNGDAAALDAFWASHSPAPAA